MLVRNDDLDVSGTSKVGCLTCSFADLVALFGYPVNVESWDKKVRVEWIFEDDDRVITIYDWKESCPVDEVTTWSVGGRSTRDFSTVVLAVHGVNCRV